ncbi:MAG: phosphoribosylformylglycinamidine synthase subunit PurQ [Phycisphaeraceae bacterium]|nr:phosphoribosylformylglycinamidine synthase subunit PurQ [Phycisphaerae bacterium]MBX3391297.1 phosphoribosylformylglycinamidine synthase subunit PurQ [Phycisphaeraceae bacterium]
MKMIAIVIRSAGTNCDVEMCRAFEMAGARARLFHVEALAREPSLLDEARLVGFPGGFSYGDDVGSGRILAMRLRESLWPALRRAAERGVPMIGACNGFQVMAQVGLLPGPGVGEPWPAARPGQSVALAENGGARFLDRWVGMRVELDSVCVWTKGLADAFDPADREDSLMLPIAHGEGRFTADSPSTLADLERTGRVALRYTEDVNGSQGSVAGICDATGRIFGLMPHPERFLEWTRHPYWTRLGTSVTGKDPCGLMMFRNAVAAA